MWPSSSFSGSSARPERPAGLSERPNVTQLVMTLLVRDEADILRANLDFHLSRGVDFFIATDNGSTDGTVEILEEYEQRGVVKLLHETDDDYAQGRWVTRMARMAYEDHGARWVINNDADEFWWTERGNLCDSLERLPAETNVVVADRFNFVPLRESERPFYERMIYREVCSLNFQGAPLPPKSCHRGHGDVIVHQGNHSISWDQPTVEAESRPIEILHFPLRTFAQFENKIRLGGAAYERNTELSAGIGRTWRALYQELKAGRLDEHYEGQRCSAEQLSRGVADGTLVEDHRLCHAMERLAKG